MRHEVVFSPAAVRDLDNVAHFITERAGVTIAESFVGRLRDYCLALDLFPERGTRRDEVAPGLRTVGYKRQATILFRVDSERKRVLILAVYYGGRDYTGGVKDVLDDDQ